MQKKIFFLIDKYARLVRLPNLLILAASQYLVRYSIIKPVLLSQGHISHITDFHFALLVLSTVLIAAGGYIINDYFDIRIDVVNRPEKIILFKHIPLRRAIWIYYTLTILGCLLGFYIALVVGYMTLALIQVIAAIALWYYSLKYKRIAFAGNFTIALLSALSLVVVWLYEFFALRHNPEVFSDLIMRLNTIHILVLGFGIFAFLVSLVREMVKDIEDIEGDRSFRCKTLPIKYGIPLIQKVIIGLTLLTMAFMAFAAYKFFTWNFNLLGWYFAVVIGLLWVYFLMLLFRAKQKKDYHFLSQMLKILMVAGVLSMQLLRVSL